MSLCKSYLVVRGKFEKTGCANDGFIKMLSSWVFSGAL